MIYLYTSKRKIPEGLKLISNIDATFNSIVGYADITVADAQQIAELENAKVINEEYKVFANDFGAFTIERLSWGAKTLMLVKYLKRKNEKYCVDVTGCGPNALELIFLEAEDTDLPVLLKHWDFLNLTNRTFCVNGKDVVYTMNDLYKHF